MRRLLALLALVVSLFAIGAGTAGLASATKPAPGHQVWVCKYVGQPGDFETLKPGKNPILVDVASADNYVGADFADGQHHSKVIDLATDANTGQGNKYIGEATCPSVEGPTTTTTLPPSSTTTPPTTVSPPSTVKPTTPTVPSTTPKTPLTPQPSIGTTPPAPTPVKVAPPTTLAYTGSTTAPLAAISGVLTLLGALALAGVRHNRYVRG
jgi:hypothetical protein